MKKKKKTNKKIALRTIVIVIISIWTISMLISWFFFKSWTESASFGDSFGSINSLFSGLALAGIIYTIYLQKTELSLQRKELKYTREELKRAALAQEESSKSLSKQIRLTNFPYLEYDSQINDLEKCITIKNKTNNVAFDLVISIFSFVDESEYSYLKFIDEHISDVNKSRIPDLSLVDDSLWSITEVGYYPNISKNKKIIIPVKFPVDNGVYSVFIQYRDVLGNNYSNLIHFTAFENFETVDDKPFSGIRIRPDYPVLTERVNPYEVRNQQKKLPDYVNQFIIYDKSSINLGITKGAKLRSNDFKWKVE